MIEMKQYRKDLRKSMTYNDFELLEDTRHKMKGALGIFHLNYLFDFLESIDENLFDEGNSIDKEKANKILEQHFKKVFTDLRFDRKENMKSF